MHVEDCHGIDYISSTVHCRTAQHSTAVQCCTLQCNAVQCSNVQYCTMLLYTVRHLIAYHGQFIVIYNTKHVSSVQTSCSVLSDLSNNSSLFTRSIGSVSESSFPSYCFILQFAICYLHFCLLHYAVILFKFTKAFRKRS
jgi:hypothetical protein